MKPECVPALRWALLSLSAQLLVGLLPAAHRC